MSLFCLREISATRRPPGTDAMRLRVVGRGIDATQRLPGIYAMQIFTVCCRISVNLTPRFSF